MDSRVRRFSLGLLAAAACLLAAMAFGHPPGTLPQAASLDLDRAGSLFGGEQVAFALNSGVAIDLGDPLISDDHVDFRDRGRYAYQDLVCGEGCDRGWVNVVYGNLIYTRQDFSIPGQGLPLEIRFTYNSGSFFNGRYGYGWQLNYDLRYITNDVNGNIIVVREDDRTDLFVKRVDGSFRATYGVRDTLEEYVPGRYLLTDREGVKYWFESSDHHYVTRIEDLNGTVLVLSYNLQRELTAVTDNAGRQLILAYAGTKLTSITDPMGRTFIYSYDGDNLIGVTDPLGHTTQYAYSTTCHDLVTITDARGNSRTITYNADFQVGSLATCCGSWTLTYDLAGKRTTVTDARGNATIYSYDQKQQVVAIQDALGQVTARTWDGAYNMTAVTDALGRITRYTYDSLGNVLSVTDALGGTTWYTYGSGSKLLGRSAVDAWSRVTSVTDANGHTTTYDYDASGNLILTTDPLGNVTTNEYDGAGQRISTTDARGVITQYAYDAYGNMTAWWIDDLIKNKTLDYGTSYSYDPVGNRISKTDANGNTTAYGYDGLNHRVVITDALGYTIDYSYDPVGNRIGETDEDGNTTAYGYDGLNRLAVITDALGCFSTYSYDPVGNRIGETDANGNTTAYSYDPLNRQVVITDALGYTTTYSYDPIGNLVGETDANGSTTAYGYDALSRQVVITDALGYTIDYSYDPVGNRIVETDENGDTTAYGYDPLDRLAVITDALGYATTYSYDPVGNRIGETDANGHTTAYSYDSLNYLVVITDALGYTIDYSYDPVGNRIGETDANGDTTAYGYDPLDRLTVITDALGYTIDYSYDPVGNRIGKTDALGRLWSYDYDAVNQVLTATSPMNSQTVYAYDCVGNIVSRTDPNGATTGYSYDAANQLVTTLYPDGSQIDYQYDGVGNRLDLSQTGGWQNATSRTYDAVNRLETEVIDYGSFTKTVSYTYDGVGNILTLTDPDGQILTYEYDAEDQQIEVTAPSGLVTTKAYDPAGRETQIHYPNGVWTAYEYDDVDQSTHITTRNAANAIILRYDYGYDPAGQLLSTFKNGIQEAVYQYNGAGWLVEADYRPVSHDYHYIYDPAGNRLNQNCPICGETTTYVYNPEDRVVIQVLPGPNPINYIYDANANVIQTKSNWGDVGYQYDFENRLTQITYPPGWGYIANYYSPEGERLARDEPSAWIYYYPTLLGVVVEMDFEGQTTARLNPGISMEPGGAGMAEGSDATPEAYIHWDNQGSTTHLTDNGAGQVADLGFGYFGELLYSAGDVDGVDPGLYATGMKVDWDPMFPGEMIGIDYWPDIAQHAGGDLFSADISDPVKPFDPHQLQAEPEPTPDTKCWSPCSGWARLLAPAQWRKGRCDSKANQEYIKQMRADVKAAAQAYADLDCRNQDGPECICVPIVSGGWPMETAEDPWTKVRDTAEDDTASGECHIRIEYDYHGNCRHGKRPAKPK
jgi:YD repeat-containing protein